MLENSVFRTLLIAAVYLVLSVAFWPLGMMNGYLTPMWPSAGFAQAVLIAGGPALWPGIFVGAVVNGVFIDSSLTGLALALLVGAGATAQPLLGASLSRRFSQRFSGGMQEGEITRLLLVTGPAACIVSASVAVLFLYGFGLIPADFAVGLWVFWWAANVLGVLLFMPLFLLLLPWAGNNSRQNIRFAVPLLITAALLVAGNFALLVPGSDQLQFYPLLLSVLAAFLVAFAVLSVYGRHSSTLSRERALRDFADNIPGAVYVSGLEPPWPKRFISQWVEDICGWPPRAFLEGRIQWGSLVFDEDRPILEREVARGIEEREKFSLQYRIRHRDGDIRWVHEIGRAVYDDSGTPFQLEGNIFDVTELVRSDLFNQATLDALDLHIAVIDNRGRILKTNKAWRHFALENGVPWQQVSEGGNYLDVCDRAAAAGDEEAGVMAGAIRDVIAGKSDTWGLEYPCHSVNDQRWFFCRVTRFPNASPPKLVISHENVTAIREAESELYASRERARVTFEHSATGLGLVNLASGRLFQVNPELCRLLGRDEADIVDRTWPEIAESEGGEQDLSFSERTDSGQAGGQVPERVFRVKNGDRPWLSVNTSIARDEQGEPLYGLLAARDVSEVRRYELTLQSLNNALKGDDFFRHISEALANVLDADAAFVGEVKHGDEGVISLRGLWMDGRAVENFEYALRGTPCEHVIGGTYCFYPDRVSELFPRDEILQEMGICGYAALPLWDSARRPLGHIGIMSRRPIGNPEAVKPVLQLLAIRAADELEHGALVRQLSESEAKYRRLVENLSQEYFFFQLDTEGYITYVSPSVSQVLGYTRETFKERHGLEYCATKESVERVEAQQKRSIRENVQVTYEVEVICADGTHRWLEVSENPLPGPKGEIRGMDGIAHDIHPRKRAEQQLQKLAHELEERVRERTRELEATNKRLETREEEMRTLVNNLHDAVVTIDDRGVVRNVNAAFTRVLGYEEAEVKDRNISMIMPEFHRQRHEEYLHNYLVTGEKHVIGTNREVEGLHKDGSTVPLELVVSEYVVQGERFFTGIMRDMSERRQSEQFLGQFKATLDRTLDGVFMTDPDTLRFIYVNDGAIRMLGYSEKELLNTTVADIRSGFTIDELLECYAPLLSGQKSSLTFESSLLHKRGYWVPVEVFLQYVKPVNDKPRFVAIARDITERKKFIDKLEKARKEAEDVSHAKSTFLATISHELRTPMNGVLGMVDVLAHSGLDDQQSEVVNTIRESGRTLLYLIDDLLDFTKIEAGGLEINVQPVSLSDIAEGVCNTLESHARQKEVDLHLFVDPELPAQLVSDEVRLRQVLYNLIGNAIKFSSGLDDRRGRVYVRVEMEKAGQPLSLGIRIEDNGIGIAPDRVENIFEPFIQLDASTSRHYSGAGLGLAVCRRLVDLMGGEISMQSTPGEGTVFSVTLPMHVPPTQPERILPDLTNLHCILVECSEYRSGDLKVYLESAGARVTVAQDGRPVEKETGPGDAGEVVIDYAGMDRPAESLSGSCNGDSSKKGRVLITRGRRRQPRLIEEGIVMLDLEALRHRNLLDAVAASAGRAFLAAVGSREAPVSEVKGAEAELDVPEAREAGRLILVAEDNEISQKVIKRQLAMLGYTADIAPNGERALEKWRDGGYALLLTDLHMPDVSGYVLTATIRNEEARRELERIPILALTADAIRVEEETRSLGIDEYITKPVQFDCLKSIMEKWLSASPKMAKIYRSQQCKDL